MTRTDGHPALEELTADEIVRLMIPCALSKDPSDQQFAKECRSAIAARKPAYDRELKARRAQQP